MSYILCIHVFFSLFWFLKFPTYRYGAAYLGTSVILIYLIILNKFKYNIYFDKIAKFFLLFIFVIVLSKNFDRIDDPAHMFYLISIFSLLNFCFNKQEKSQFFLNKFILFSVTTFLIKQFYILVFIISLLIFLRFFRKFEIFSRSNIFCCLFLLCWFLKNFLVTSCVLYPVSFTCINSVKWSPNNFVADPKKVSISSEAWAKAYPDRINKSKSYLEHLSDYEWIIGWKNVHAKVVLKKLLPLLILLSLFTFFFITKVKKIKIIYIIIT